MDKAFDGLLCHRVRPVAVPLVDLLHRYPVAGNRLVVPLQVRPGDDFLHASALSTVTRTARYIQEVVSPLPRNSLQAIDHMIVHHQAATYTRAHDHTEHNLG